VEKQETVTVQDIQQTFYDLCMQVMDAYQSTGKFVRPEPVDTEPQLIALLHVVQAHPEQRATFVQLFIKVAEGAIPSPWFLLGFCMHTLRYPEVYHHLLAEYRDGYTRPTFARRLNYIWLNLAIFDDQDPLFVHMWPYYRNDSYGQREPT
jgi:hypothetical protein